LADGERQSDWAADIGTRVFWLALLVGLIVGVIGTGFHLLVDALTRARMVLVAGGFDQQLQLQQLVQLSEDLLTRYDLRAYVPAGLMVDPILGARFAATALIVAMAVTLARWLVRRFAPEAAGSGVQEIEGMLLGWRRLRWQRILPVKFVGGTLALGTGLVLGREGPTIHMGGAASLGLARAVRSSPSETMALIAAGAGAGLAAAFNAPIAGVLFVIEEMRREAPYNFQGYHAVLIACVAAVFVTQGISGVGPELRLPMVAPPLHHYPLFLVLGVLLGAFGAVFNRMIMLSLDFFSAWSTRAGWSLVLTIAVGITVLLFLLPAGAGGGEQIVQSLQGQMLGLDALALLLLVRLAATLASYAAGTPGGVFAPILGLATVAGLGFVEVARHLAPGLELEPSAFIAAAMAALFTGSVRAPLVGVVLVAELTDGYPALLAITLATAMASLTAAALGGRPLYEMLLERTLRLSQRSTGVAA
jgi:CIC family chloride channel protein